MKKNIAIICGGDSSEHEVSLRSAAGIQSWLAPEKYNATKVVIRGSQWQAMIEPQGRVVPTDQQLVESGKSQGRVVPTDQQLVESDIAVDIDKNDFSYTLNGEKHSFDFAYITIHGTPGENGLLQGYLDMIGLPYSCCGVLAAALTFNKYACNHYLESFGIKISPSVLLRKNANANAEEIVAKVGLPCFIKSNVGGSSFGCTKVKRIEDVEPAIERAFKEGDEVICEAFMQGTEITCGVYKAGQESVALPITEVVAHNEFFDYDAKYKGQVDEITPARIPDDVRDRVQACTMRIYDIIGAKGIIRVDYILTEGWQINLLEVNTTPGMTPTSFIPQQVRASGRTMSEVLEAIIES